MLVKGKEDVVDYEEISVGATPVGLDQAKLTPTIEKVWIFIEDGPLRYRSDGLDPSPTSGVALYDGAFKAFYLVEARKLRMVRMGVTNGMVRVLYAKEI